MGSRLEATFTTRRSFILLRSDNLRLEAECRLETPITTGRTFVPLRSDNLSLEAECTRFG